MNADPHPKSLLVSRYLLAAVYALLPKLAVHHHSWLGGSVTVDFLPPTSPDRVELQKTTFDALDTLLRAGAVPELKRLIEMNVRRILVSNSAKAADRIAPINNYIMLNIRPEKDSSAAEIAARMMYILTGWGSGGSPEMAAAAAASVREEMLRHRMPRQFDVTGPDRENRKQP